MLCGRERLQLQGLNADMFESTIRKTPEGSLNLLAGNSLNFYNAAQGLLAAFATLGLPWFVPK